MCSSVCCTADGLPRRVPKSEYLVPYALLAKRWRDDLRAQLCAIRTDDGAFESALAAIPASVWRRKWVVDLQPVGSGEKALGYLARYVQKTALDHARILAADARGVTIGWRDRETKKPRQATLGGHEFLRRFLQHVLPGGFMRIRHCGFYAPAAQARYQRLCAFLAHENKPVEPWVPKCAKCGERVFIISIKAGKRTIIPQASIDCFGLECLRAERPP